MLSTHIAPYRAPADLGVEWRRKYFSGLISIDRVTVTVGKCSNRFYAVRVWKLRVGISIL